VPKLIQTDLAIVRLGVDAVKPLARFASCKLRLRSCLALCAALRQAGPELRGNLATARPAYLRNAVEAAVGVSVHFPRRRSQLARNLSKLLDAGCADAPGLLQHAPPGLVRDAIIVLAARRHEQQSVLARERGEHAKAFSSIHLARQLVAQAAEERSQRGASVDLGLRELADSIEAGYEYMAGLIQIDAAKLEVEGATADADRINMRGLIDALDRCMNVARNAPDAEVQAMACSYAAHIYIAAIKDEARAIKLATSALQRANACPSSARVLKEPWFSVTLKLLRLKQLREDEREERLRRSQAVIDAPILAELKPAMQLIDQAYDLGWQAFIEHIYAAHPVVKGVKPSMSRPDDRRKAIFDMLLVYHPDKCAAKGDRKLSLLHEHITKLLNRSLDSLKGV
jgi:hypothetical protein